jgi:hypothetical protein
MPQNVPTNRTVRSHGDTIPDIFDGGIDFEDGIKTQGFKSGEARLGWNDTEDRFQYYNDDPTLFTILTDADELSIYVDYGNFSISQSIAAGNTYTYEITLDRDDYVWAEVKMYIPNSVPVTDNRRSACILTATETIQEAFSVCSKKLEYNIDGSDWLFEQTNGYQYQDDGFLSETNMEGDGSGEIQIKSTVITADKLQITFENTHGSLAATAIFTGVYRALTGRSTGGPGVPPQTWESVLSASRVTGGGGTQNPLISAGDNLEWSRTRVLIEECATIATANRTLTRRDPGADDYYVYENLAQTLTNKTFTVPTIGDFTNANHNHQNVAGGGILDHGLALAGSLLDDDHTQYALLAGRSGGQVLIGGTGASEELALRGTSNANLGLIRMQSGITFDDISAGHGIQPYNIVDTSTQTIPGGFVGGMINASPNITFQNALFVWFALNGSPTITSGVAPGFSIFALLQATPTFIGNSFNPMSHIIVSAGPIVQTNSAGRTALSRGFQFGTQLKATANLASMTSTETTAVRVAPQWSTVAGSTIDFGPIRGLWCNTPSVAFLQPSAGTETLQQYIGVEYDNITLGGDVPKVVVRSALAPASNAYFLQNNGGAQSHLGLDNTKIFLGDAEDAEIYWNGSHLILDPDPVTSAGIVYIGATADDTLACSRIQLGPSPATEYFTSLAGYLQMWFDDFWEVYVTGGILICNFSKVGTNGCQFDLGSESYISCNTGDLIFLDDNPELVEILSDIKMDDALEHAGSTAGFYATTPIAQPTDIGALTDNTTGSVDGTLVNTAIHHGEIYVRDNVTATTISVQDTWYQLTIFANNGPSFGATPDHTNDHITIAETGDYSINVSISFSGGAGKTYEIMVQKNNGATEHPSLICKRKLGSGGDVGSTSISGIVSLTSGDTVEVWMRCRDVTTANATVVHGNLYLMGCSCPRINNNFADVANRINGLRNQQRSLGLMA